MKTIKTILLTVIIVILSINLMAMEYSARNFVVGSIKKTIQRGVYKYEFKLPFRGFYRLNIFLVNDRKLMMKGNNLLGREDEKYKIKMKVEFYYKEKLLSSCSYDKYLRIDGIGIYRDHLKHTLFWPVRKKIKCIVTIDEVDKKINDFHKELVIGLYHNRHPIINLFFD